MIQRLLLLSIVALFIPATCLAAPTTKQFESKFQEALPLCEQLALPNSMARKPGFDLNSHLKNIEAELHGRSEFFRSDEGSRFLLNRIKAEQDSINKQCAERLLGTYPSE